MARGVTGNSFDEYDKYAKANVPGYGTGGRGGAVNITQTPVIKGRGASGTKITYTPSLNAPAAQAPVTVADKSGSGGSIIPPAAPVTGSIPSSFGTDTSASQPVPATDHNVAAGISNGTINAGDMAPGTGVIVVDGKPINVGGSQPVQTQAQSFGARPAEQDPFVAASQSELQRSQAILNKEITGTTVAQDGTILSEGAQGVGAGIVARGALNRAKMLGDIGNNNLGARVQQQNADTAATSATEMAGYRNREATRQEADSKVTRDVAQTTQRENGKIIALRDQYLAETDPAKREKLAADIQVLTGKAPDPKFQPVMGKDDMGTPTYLGAFDNRTGELNSGTIGGGARTPAPAKAIAMLQQNPALAEQFKAKYGYLP
jgi:hypothetical protein